MLKDMIFAAQHLEQVLLIRETNLISNQFTMYFNRQILKIQFSISRIKYEAYMIVLTGKYCSFHEY